MYRFHAGLLITTHRTIPHRFLPTSRDCAADCSPRGGIFDIPPRAELGLAWVNKRECDMILPSTMQSHGVYSSLLARPTKYRAEKQKNKAPQYCFSTPQRGTFTGFSPIIYRKGHTSFDYFTTLITRAAVSPPAQARIAMANMSVRKISSSPLQVDDLHIFSARRWRPLIILPLFMTTRPHYFQSKRHITPPIYRASQGAVAHLRRLPPRLSPRQPSSGTARSQSRVGTSFYRRPSSNFILPPHASMARADGDATLASSRHGLATPPRACTTGSPSIIS